MTKHPHTGPGYYHVRIVLYGGTLDLASATMPRVRYAQTALGEIAEVDADWLQNPTLGETLGWVNWPAVKSITWRWTPLDEPLAPDDLDHLAG